MSTAIGIDLGGTRIKGVAIDTDGTLLHQLYTDTNDGDGAVWKQAVALTMEELLQNVNATKGVIGISAPGLPDDEHRAIAYMPGRMPGLENFIWTDYLKHPAYVLNDAVAALIAETKFGAARKKKHVVMLTLGTGVGGAILIDGKPYQGAFHKAGHMGHMVINDSEDCDVTGMPGSLEQCIGNCTISQRSKGRFSSTRDMLEAYRNGDSFAKEVWLTSVRRLAIGLASITNILSPQTIVLGGGITEAGNDLFEPLQEFMSQYEWRAGGNQVEIKKAMYGDLAGAIGAACFAMSKVDQKIVYHE
jgi:glucokinase